MLNENNLNTIALATNERSQLQGIIQTQDVLRFLVDNYKGNIDFFQHSFMKFEDATNMVGHTSHNKNMVTAWAQDTLYEVLRKLRDKNVSMIIIERMTLVRQGPQQAWGEVWPWPEHEDARNDAWSQRRRSREHEKWEMDERVDTKGPRLRPTRSRGSPSRRGP